LPIVDHSGHTFLIERTFKKNHFRALDQFGESFPEGVGTEMSCPDKKSAFSPFLDPPYRPQLFFFPPEKVHSFPLLPSND